MELLKQAIHVLGLHPKVVVLGEAEGRKVVSRLVRLEVARKTGLAERQREQQEERRDRRKDQIDGAAHGGGV